MQVQFIFQKTRLGLNFPANGLSPSVPAPLSFSSSVVTSTLSNRPIRKVAFLPVSYSPTVTKKGVLIRSGVATPAGLASRRENQRQRLTEVTLRGEDEGDDDEAKSISSSIFGSDLTEDEEASEADVEDGDADGDATLVSIVYYSQISERSAWLGKEVGSWGEVSLES